MRRLPAEQPLCVRAGRRIIELREGSEEAEALRGVIRGDADRWQSQAAADRFGDGAKRDALVRDAVQPREVTCGLMASASSTLFNRAPKLWEWYRQA